MRWKGGWGELSKVIEGKLKTREQRARGRQTMDRWYTLTMEEMGHPTGNMWEKMWENNG